MKILLLEDDISQALDIRMLVDGLDGVDIVVTRNLDMAQRSLTDEAIDIIIADIHLEDNHNSLEWLTKLDIDIPAIIITGDSSIDNYEGSKDIQALSFLSKPLDMMALQFEIEKFQKQLHESQDKEESRILLIKDGPTFHRLDREHIIWVSTEGNYSTIKTPDKKIVIKKSLSKVINEFDLSHMTQISRSSVINIDRLYQADLVRGSAIMSDNEVLHISKSNRRKMSKLLNDRSN